MMRKSVNVLTVVFLSVFFFAAATPAQSLKDKKVLIIDSYHEGYPWSDAVVQAAVEILRAEDIHCKVSRMDTKRNTSADFARRAAEKIRGETALFKPDLIIACDDSASKYVIAPFFKNTDIPCVFCGVNWDAAAYGFPCRNVTGVIEVEPVRELVGFLRKFAKGARVGYIACDDETQRKVFEAHKKILGPPVEGCFVKSFAEWKKAFPEFQKKCDLIIVANHGDMIDWNKDEAEKFMLENTKIPTGCYLDFMLPYCMAGLVKQSREHGERAADMALKILRGAAPSSIPEEKNTRGDLMINARFFKVLGIELSPEILGGAQKVIY
jgi:ABC-type uncharacterized transport system substrate-binding protein